jgi:hypothetical protein
MPEETTTTGAADTTTQTTTTAAGDPAASTAAKTADTKPTGILTDPADSTTKAGDPAADSADSKKGDAPVGAPEKYELKPAEGFTLDEALLAKAEPVFKELNLTNEQAQKAADLFAAIKTQEAADSQAAIVKQVEDWFTAVKTDPEIGGKVFDTTVKHAQAAIGRFASPSLKQFLSDTGLRNHPELVRTFAKIGAAMSEDTISTGSSAKEKPDAASRIFPSMNKK